MALFPPSMAQPSRRTEPRRRAAAAILVAAVAGPTLWLGGAPPGAAVLATLLSATALGLLVASDSGRLVVPPLALLPLSVAGLCALQLVPLPPALLALLSPPLGELRAFALVPLGLDGWRPLSHDPPATAAAFTGSLTAAAALIAAAGLSRSRTRRRQLAAGIGLTGLAVALIGFGHALADASTLFGLHRFQNGQLPFLTPFGNPNHLAAFATLASALLLGLAADSHPHRPRQALWLGAAVAVGAAAFLSLSRGGIAFWCAGQLAFLLLLLRRRDAPGTAGRAIPVALAVGTVAFVAGYLALDRIGARLATVDSLEKLQSSKVDLWPMFSRPALAAWLTGLGRGTFAVAFPRWQTAHSTLTFTFEYPENLPLQLATELGLPATLGLLALAAWATFRTARARNGAPLVLAAWAGVGALVLHDLFDFALELPACATAAAVALGIASGPWVEQHDQRLRRTPALAGLAAVALLAVLGLVRGADSAARAEARLAAHATGHAASVRDEARALVDRHPADAVLYRIAGWTEATRPGGQPRVALAWLNRALFLQPLDPDTHRVVARALFQLGAPTQALVEERLALESGAETAAILAEALPRARDVDALWNLVGENPSHVDLLVTTLWQRGRTDDARGLLDRALLAFEGRPESAALTVTAARVRLQTGDPAGALVLLETAEQAGQDVALPRAEALARLGRRRDAIRTLESAIARKPGDAEIAFALAGYLVAEGRPALARAALDRIQPFLGAGGPRTRLVLNQAETYRVEGRYGRALDLVQTAMRLSPGEPGLHRQAAELYEALKRPHEALHEVEVAVSLSGQPADPGTRAWMERLRTAVDTETLRALDPARGLDGLEPPDAGTEGAPPRRVQGR
ncbi:MAG TPA: tetratricopeptide repeat protein [Anaeromyxobacter sp.]|nr:tetratricopeptide repeat protein [Anaeromyxobacter sp.]